MQIYRIARMDIAVEVRFDATKEYMKDFLSDSADYELFISVTDEMLDYERTLNREIHGDEASDWLCEVIAILRVICDHIIRRGGFFLHCSCLRIDDAAVIFTAPSGTGTSTHAALWRRHFGDRVSMINDDKPLVREEDGSFVIYGTPWNGKHRIGNNISAPIKAILFLEQAKKNYTKPLEPVDALTLLLQQTVMPTDPGEMSILLDMLSRLIEAVPMIRLGCNISDEAVVTAYEAVRQYL